MLTDADVLETVRSWIDEDEAVAASGNTSDIEISSPDRDPASISWIYEGSRYLAQIVVWSDGQFEADFGDAQSGEVTVKSGRAGNLDELVDLLQSARGWVHQDS